MEELLCSASATLLCRRLAPAFVWLGLLLLLLLALLPPPAPLAPPPLLLSRCCGEVVCEEVEKMPESSWCSW